MILRSWRKRDAVAATREHVVAHHVVASAVHLHAAEVRLRAVVETVAVHEIAGDRVVEADAALSAPHERAAAPDVAEVDFRDDLLFISVIFRLF